MDSNSIHNLREFIHNGHFELQFADNAADAERLPSSRADARRAQGAGGSIGACAVRLAETEIVVGAHVYCAHAAAGVPEVPVVIARLALEQVELSAGRTADRPVEAVAQTAVNVALVVRLEAAIEWHEFLHTIKLF